MLSEHEASSDRLEEKTSDAVRTRGIFGQAGRKNGKSCPNTRHLRTGWKKKLVMLSEHEAPSDRLEEKKGDPVRFEHVEYLNSLGEVNDNLPELVPS
jgi:hypothetical protein